MDNGINVLVVDDEELITEMLHDYLSAKKFSVTSTTSPNHAIALIDSAKFDVVITDLMMSPVDGTAIVRHLNDKGFQGKIIVMSGFKTEMQRISKQLCIDRCLEKPFDLAQMYDMVMR